MLLTESRIFIFSRKTILILPFVLISLFSATIQEAENVKVKVNDDLAVSSLKNITSADLKQSVVKRSTFSNYLPSFLQSRSGQGQQSGMEKAEARQYGHGHGWGWQPLHYHQQYYHSHDQNMDLYSLLGGLSFASLLGATIVFLARRNTTGRRRRSIDSIFEDEDEVDETPLILDAIHDPKF